MSNAAVTERLAVYHVTIWVPRIVTKSVKYRNNLQPSVINLLNNHAVNIAATQIKINIHKYVPEDNKLTIYREITNKCTSMLERKR